MGGRTPIWLVGMMGSGKSALAPLLAEQLGRPSVDTDERVEHRAGRSIAQIFEGQGEAHFRKLECECIADLETGDAVVALGGGAMAQPGVSERLLQSGTVVYLRARPHVLLERIGDPDSRPLLRGLDSSERLRRMEALLREREPVYRKAHITWDTEVGFEDEAVRECAVRLRAFTASVRAGRE